MSPNPLQNYPLMQNPALDGMVPADQPLEPIQAASEQQGQLGPIGGGAPDLSAFKASDPNVKQGYQPNPLRQQREQGLMEGINKYEHPEAPQGFWGKTKHVLSTIGNIAGDIFAPSTMALIPGTQLHNEQQQGQRIRDLQQLEGEDREDQQQFDKEQQEQLKQPLLNAETRKTNAEAAKDENPQPEPLQHLETDQGIFAFNPKTKELTPLTFQGKTLMKPTTAKEISPVQDLQSQILAAEEKGDTATANTLQKRLRDLTPNAEASLAAQMARFAASQSEKGDKQDTQTRQAAYKAFQPALDSGERFNVMAKNYEDAIKNHDQQAMLSLLANHLGMTMGLQKGARLTKDIIHEAEQSRPWLQGISAKFDKNGVLAGVTLTPEQMRQMVDLGRGRFNEDTVKARNEARYLGAQDDGPERTPSKSTINFYLGQANGDVTKAKQLATEDGWTVK